MEEEFAWNLPKRSEGVEGGGEMIGAEDLVVVVVEAEEEIPVA